MPKAASGNRRAERPSAQNDVYLTIISSTTAHNRRRECRRPSRTPADTNQCRAENIKIIYAFESRRQRQSTWDKIRNGVMRPAFDTPVGSKLPPNDLENFRRLQAQQQKGRFAQAI